MKGAVEYFMLMLVFMVGVLFAFNFYGVYQQNHNAHAYRDQIANLIENYDGDVHQVKEIMAESTLCSSCSYTTLEEDSLVFINVKYTLKLHVLGISHDVIIKGLSYLPN